MSQDNVPVPSPAAGEAQRVHAEPETAAARLVAPPSLVEQAALYATRGFRVVINHGLDPNGNCTCGNYTGKCPSPSGKSSAGKHPRHSSWLENAITTEAGARAEWLQRPNSNIGIAPPEGVVVLDVDPRNGGDKTWDSLVEECGQIEGPTACTGGGGLHIWIRIPEGLSLDEARRRIKGALEQRGTGIDLRDANTQVIVAPSMHASGTSYAWMPGRSVLECDPLVPSEPWLRALRLAAGKAEPTAPFVSREDLLRPQHDDLDRARYGLLEAGLLDAGADYGDWFRVIAALKALGTAAKEIAEAWSKTSSKYDDGDVDRRWEGIAGSSPATLFWLFDHASPTWRNDYRRSRGLAPAQIPMSDDCLAQQVGAATPSLHQPRALRARTYEEVLAEPPVEFLLEGFLQKDGINLVAGDPSVGKSLFAQDLIQRVARGSSMFDLATIPGSVNYFYAEGRMGPRLRAWQSGNPGAGALVHPVQFVELPELTSLADVLAMKAYLAQHPASLNIVDTLGLAASGADENAASGASSMGQVMREIGRMRDEFCGTWVIIHHLTKDKSRAALDRIRGSSAIRANCDSIVLLEEAGKDTIKVTVGKQRDGATGLQINLRKLPVHISDEETGVILVPCEEASITPSLDVGPAFVAKDRILRFAKAAGVEGTTRAEICREIELKGTKAYELINELCISSRLKWMKEVKNRLRYWHPDHVPVVEVPKAAENTTETSGANVLSPLPSPFRGRQGSESTEAEGDDDAGKAQPTTLQPKKKRRPRPKARRKPRRDISPEEQL